MQSRAERCAVVMLLGAVWLAAAATAHGAPRAADPPDDPLFRHQWNLHAIQIPSAWAVSRGRGAVVAVLDTGVAYRDRGAFRRAPDFAGTRFVPGWDFVDDDPYPLDVPPPDGRRSHGTHIAALIAQTAGNALGAAGVAPAASIMPIRVLTPDLRGSAHAIARGLRFAADHGADVANLSIAGPSPTRVLTKALDYAVAKGVTIVAAAGNGGGSSVGWPAAHPKVVAVGSVTKGLTRATYSNYGARLDLVAPTGAGAPDETGYGPSDGVVAQTLKGGPSAFCFCFTASTSAAAAQVSGVAALLSGSKRASTPAKVRAALLSGARDLGPRGRDGEYGAGLVQARRSLDLVRAGSGEPASSGSSRKGWVILAAAGTGLAGLTGVLIIARRRRRSAA